MNSQDRLRGDARALGLVCTQDRFEFTFDVWSERRGCFASDIQKRRKGRQIWGMLYEIPDHLMLRQTSPPGRRSMDAIEGEGINYRRTPIAVRWRNGKVVRQPVITYTVISPVEPGETSREYAGLILSGLLQHKAPRAYVKYIKRRIVESNPALNESIDTLGVAKR